MSDDPFILSQAFNLSRSDTAICVPLFMKYPDNFPYIAVMDSNLQINNFQPFLNFENYQVCIPGDLPIPYAYRNGDFAPLILNLEGKLEFIHAHDRQGLLEALASRSENIGDIFNELLENLLGTLGRTELEDRIPDDGEFIRLKPNDDEFAPRPARLWLDESVRGLREFPTDEQAAEREASSARYRLLKWAKDYGEYATSNLFRHFLDVIRLVDDKGIYTKDILAVALLKRISEKIPRSQTATNLIGDFRVRNGRSPLFYATELSERADDLFSQRASEVLSLFFDAADKAVEENNLSKMLLFAFAIDDEKLWPEFLRRKIDRRLYFFREQLSTYISQEHENLERMSELRDELEAQAAGYRSYDNEALVKARALRDKMSKVRVQTRQAMIVLDALEKIRTGLPLNTSNLELASISYHRLGLNPSYMEYSERAFDEFNKRFQSIT